MDPFLKHPKAWIRKEAGKALARLAKGTTWDAGKLLLQRIPLAGKTEHLYKKTA